MGRVQSPEEQLEQKELNVEMGKRLLKWRTEKGYTQDHVGNMLGVSGTYYGRIERGTAGFSTLRIKKAFEKLDIDCTYLLTGIISTDINLELFIDKCPEEKRKDLKELIELAMKLAKM